MKIRFLLLLLLAAGPASAMFAPPRMVPVETLEKNAAAYTAAHPREANGWYVLARIHYLAFVGKAADLATVMRQPEEEPPVLYRGYGMATSPMAAMRAEAERRALKKLGLDAMPSDPEPQQKYQEAVEAALTELRNGNWTPPVPAPEELARHVRESFANFDKALALAPDNALYQLGKASLLQQYAEERPNLEKAGLKDLPPVATADARAEAFYRAFSLAKDKDATSRSMPLLGLSDLVSHEAGAAYLKLLPAGPKAKEVEAQLDKLKSLPPGPITPIVFSMDGAVTSLAGMVAPEANVAFDLTGFGRADVWPWIRGSTSLLVWDPSHEGHIRDGRQLFGSYTWGIFWENGFRALAMLDSDHDGMLSGRELDGLAAWTDANGDGISSRAEVVPLSQLHVRSLAVHERGSDGIHPHHPEGITLDDGTTRPTWDWITRAVMPEK